MKTLTDAAMRLAPLAVAALFVVATPAQDGPSLHDCMEGIKDNLKALSQSLEDDARQADSLKHVSLMQSYVMIGKELEPSNLYDMPEDQRHDHSMAYRSDMAKTLGALAEMEQHICAGDNASAMAAIRGQLLTLRNDSHDKYQVEDH